MPSTYCRLYDLILIYAMISVLMVLLPLSFQCLQADSSGSGSASQGLLDACDLHPTTGMRCCRNCVLFCGNLTEYSETGHVLCCCKELAVVGSVAYTEVWRRYLSSGVSHTLTLSMRTGPLNRSGESSGCQRNAPNTGTV